MEEVENLAEFSTAERLKTEVFHKVMHIIHRKQEKRMGKKRGQTSFLKKFEKLEFAGFRISEKKEEIG